MIAIGPMVYAQMAEDGKLPKFFRMSDQVPRTAIMVQGLLSIAVVWLSQIKDIVTYLGLTLTAWRRVSRFERLDRRPVHG